MVVSKDDFPLLKRLGGFLASDSLEGFRRDALRRCSSIVDFLAAGGQALETSHLFSDYLAFSHRDADGRLGVDLFLAEEGPLLDPEERTAFTRMRETVFGLFEIEEYVPPHVRVRRVGTDDRYEVAIDSDREKSPPGSGFIARLVPWREHHVLTGFCLSLKAEQVFEMECLLRPKSPEWMSRFFTDPIQCIESLMAGLLKDRPPRNLREAEIYAAPIFTAADFPFTVKEVEARFRRSGEPFEILKDCGLIRVSSPEQFRRLTDAILFLWKHTPKGERVGGLPEEKRGECRCKKEPVPTFEVTFERVEGEYGRVRIRDLGNRPSGGN